MKPGKIKRLFMAEDLPARDGLPSDERNRCPSCKDFLPPDVDICPYCMRRLESPANDHRVGRRRKGARIDTAQLLMLVAIIYFWIWMEQQSIGLGVLAFACSLPWILVLQIIRAGGLPSWPKDTKAGKTKRRDLRSFMLVYALGALIGELIAHNTVGREGATAIYAYTAICLGLGFSGGLTAAVLVGAAD